MKALVLSGGGARGAYQMGVWKALRKLNMSFDIVTGTSIGAINGMMYTQNNYYKCLKLWKEIDYKKIFEDFDIKDNKELYTKYFDKAIKGGLNTKKIEKLISENYNPTKLYNSKITFGVVTYNLTSKEELYATTKNTNPKKLKEYILASASCFPVFKPAKVGKDKFIDGGFYDNLPINLAVELGAKEILAIDLEAVGLVKKVKDKNINIKYIRPNNKLDSFLMFDKSAAKRMINLGYNDTMKAFDKLEGKIYTFKRGTINKLYKLYKRKYLKKAKQYDINVKNKNKNEVLRVVEQTMEIFKVPEDKIYNFKTLQKTLMESLNNTEDAKINEYNDIKKIFNTAVIAKFIYTKMDNNDKINYNIFNLFYKEIEAALLLQLIKR